MRRRPDWMAWIAVAIVAAGMFYVGTRMRDAMAQEPGDFVLVPKVEMEKFFAAYVELTGEYEKAQRTIQSLRASLACT